MTITEKRIIAESNQQPNFSISDLIRTLVRERNHKVQFTTSPFFSDRYEILGRITQESRSIKFTVDKNISDTRYSRYAYALLLVIYLEVYPEYPNGENLAYISSDGEILSDDLELEGRPIQSMLNRTARDILINDELFEEDLEKRIFPRQLSERYGVPSRIIIEKFDDMGF